MATLVTGVYPGETLEYKICEKGSSDFTCDCPLKVSIRNSTDNCIIVEIYVPSDTRPDSYYCYYTYQGEVRRYRPTRLKYMDVEINKTHANAIVTFYISHDSRPLEDVDVDVFYSGKKVAYGYTGDSGIFSFIPSESGEYFVELDRTKFRKYLESFNIDDLVLVVETTTTTTTLPETATTSTTLQDMGTTTTTTTTTIITTTSTVAGVSITSTSTTTTTTMTTIATGGNSDGDMSVIWLIVFVMFILGAGILLYLEATEKSKGDEEQEEE